MLDDFKVFQLAKKFHWGCKSAKISFVLRDQLVRASASVALNIAEGSGKRTLLDQRRFYGMALGSLRESQAILELEKIEDKELSSLASQIGAMLFTLTRAAPKPQTETKLQTKNQTQTSLPTPNWN
jgi:four helix bundle protein